MKLPFPKTPDGMCLPAALANAFNHKDILDTAGRLAEQWELGHWDFHHGNVVLSLTTQPVIYLNVFVAMDNFVSPDRFMNSKTMIDLMSSQGKIKNEYVLLMLEVQMSKSTHAVAVIMNFKSGMCQIVDPAKPNTMTGNANLMFSYYNIVKIAIAMNTVNSVATFHESAFAHAIPGITVVK